MVKMIVRAGIIIKDQSEEKTLLVLGRESLKWGFPKGFIETEEDAVTAAIRETYEETGIMIEKTSLEKYEVVDNTILYNYQMMTPIELKKRENTEIKEVQWIAIKDLNNLNLTRDVRKVFKIKSDNKNIIKVGVLIINRKSKKLLILKRIVGFYRLPFVSLKIGESEKHAAIRCLSEQLGLLINKNKLVKKIRFDDTNYYLLESDENIIDVVQLDEKLFNCVNWFKIDDEFPVDKKNIILNLYKRVYKNDLVQKVSDGS